MHSNAVIISTLTGLRFTQCPKCQERHVLSPGFVHGSHLCCKGCGENLLLQELSMGELENFTQPVGLVNDPRCFDTPPSALATTPRHPSKMPMWGGCSGDAVLSAREMTKQLQERGFLVRTNVGGGKTAAMFGTVVHQAMDASQRNEKLKQELIRQYTNAAAFKLGSISKRMQQRDQTHANSRKKGIKDQLAQNLKLIGCTYTEIGEIISELVEGLKNV